MDKHTKGTFDTLPLFSAGSFDNISHDKPTHHSLSPITEEEDKPLPLPSSLKLKKSSSEEELEEQLGKKNIYHKNINRV